MDAANCISVTVNAGGGNSIANFTTTANGADTFNGNSAFSSVVGAGNSYNNSVLGFAQTSCTAGGPNAVAYLATAATGTNTFAGVQGYSFVQGTTYYSQALNFASVIGFAGSTGSTAYLGLPSGTGANVFGGVPTYSFVQGQLLHRRGGGFRFHRRLCRQPQRRRLPGHLVVRRRCLHRPAGLQPGFRQRF